MAINFIFFTSFLLIFSLNGRLLSYWYLKDKKLKYDLFEINNLIVSLFAFGIFALILNFFLPLNSIYIKILMFVTTTIALFKFRDNIFLSLKKNILLIFFLSLICFYMKAGYDAALYHLPHQSFIREYKIIFGLVNLHERFALTSLYGHIASLFWFKNNLILLTFLQGIFYFLLVKDIYSRIVSNDILAQITGMSTIIFTPVWLRYIQPSFGLVDLPAGILFYLSFVKGIDVLILKKNIKEDTKIFLISSALLFAFKPSYLLFSVYVFYILFFSIKLKLININNLISYIYLPIILIFAWLTKSFINSGCLIFPLELTCFDTSWTNMLLVHRTFNEITEYGKIYSSYLTIENLRYYLSIFNFTAISFFISTIFIIGYLLIKSKKSLYLKNFYIGLLIFINILLLLNINVITGFSYLVKSDLSSENMLGRNIFFKEIFLVLFVIFSSFIISISTAKNNNIVKKIPIGKLTYFPLIFLFFFTLIWFFSSPNPRFLIGYLAIIPLCLILLFSDNFKLIKKIKPNFLILFFFTYIVFTISILIKKDFLITDVISIPQKKIPNVETVNRKYFGVRPSNYCNDIFGSNLCWIEKNCYFIEKDARLDYLKFNYIIIKKIVDRRHPKCTKN